MKIKEVEIEAVRFMKNKVDSRGGPLGLTNKRRLVFGANPARFFGSGPVDCPQFVRELRFVLGSF